MPRGQRPTGGALEIHVGPPRGRHPRARHGRMLSGAETDRQRREARDVEAAVRDVYGFCPPTRTYYASEEARRAAAEWWGGFLGRLGAGPERFRGADVLDVGCGSCEKTALYHDWGARVIGIDSTPEVLALAREVVGTRAVHLVRGSFPDFQ